MRIFVFTPRPPAHGFAFPIRCDQIKQLLDPKRGASGGHDVEGIFGDEIVQFAGSERKRPRLS